MAKRKDIDATSSEPASNAPEPAQAESELPTVESPSISPATPAPVIAPIAELAPAIEPIVEAAPAAAPKIEAPATPRRFTFNARHKRNALLAVSVAIAAALGAVVGAVASGGFAAPARTDVAGLEETKAMQQSIARLSNEITTLKTSIEAANKCAFPDRQDQRTLRSRRERRDHWFNFGAPNHGAAPNPTAGAARRRGTESAAGAPASGAGLVDPRRARRLYLRARPRRHLSGRARRTVARSWCGGIGQAAGRPLGGGDAKGNYRFHA